MRGRALVLILGLLAVALLASGASVAWAQTFQLTTCAWSDLSSAVTAANSNGQDDTINLKQGCTYAEPSSVRYLEVADDGGHALTITGFGTATISHPYGTDRGNSTALLVDPSTQLTLNRVAVSAACGSASQCPAPGPPTIQNNGELILNGSSVSNGLNTSGISSARVSSAYPSPSLTLNRTTVSGNDGWGVSASDGTTWVTNSQISGNKSGGIQNGSTLHIGTSTIADNTTRGPNGCLGAGITNGGKLTVFASTIARNVTSPQCYGLYGAGGGISNGGTAWITDTTIADNTGASGGGVYQWNNGHISILWSTLSGNTARYASTGGNVRSVDASGVLLKGAIIANGGSGHDCLQDVAGAIIDGGYNIADDATCALTSAKHSLASTSPGLDPNGLQSNGGPTQTIALLASSPAIDFVPLSSPGAAPPKMDQRLLPRPDAAEASTDAGAYELQDN